MPVTGPIPKEPVVQGTKYISIPICPMPKCCANTEKTQIIFRISHNLSLELMRYLSPVTPQAFVNRIS